MAEISPKHNRGKIRLQRISGVNSDATDCAPQRQCQVFWQENLTPLSDPSIIRRRSSAADLGMTAFGVKLFAIVRFSLLLVDSRRFSRRSSPEIDKQQRKPNNGEQLDAESRHWEIDGE